MKKLFFLFITTLAIIATRPSFGQKPDIIIRIEEDYSNPIGRHYEKSTKFVERKIEKGIYMSESSNSAINAKLEFGLRIEQRNCFFENDAEFEILKTGKSKSADFIGIKFILWEIEQGADTTDSRASYSDYDLAYYWLFYNNEGAWKLMNGNSAPSEVVQSGTVAVNPDKNTLKVEHLPKQTNFYLNGTKLCDLTTARISKLKWSDFWITAESNKTKIGLDKVVFIGYFNKKNPSLTDTEVYGMNIQSFRFLDGMAAKPLGAAKYKYMDKWGRIKGNAEFDEIDFSQNKALMFWAKNNGLCGYVNFEGNWAVEPIYTEASKSECFDKEACLPGHFRVKNAEGKEFLVNVESNIVPLENGKLAGVNAMPKDKGTSNLKEGFTAFSIGKYTLNVYSNWVPHLRVNDANSASTDMGKNTIDILGNGPKTWVNKDNQPIYGSFSITIEEVESTYEKEKDNLITHFAKAKASRWDSEKGDYKHPTVAEIGKEKLNIKPVAESVILADGSTGKSLFYIGNIPYVGKTLNYVIIAPIATNSKLVKKFSMKITGETIAIMEPSDFKQWNDYFKASLTTFKAE